MGVATSKSKRLSSKSSKSILRHSLNEEDLDIPSQVGFGLVQDLCGVFLVDEIAFPILETHFRLHFERKSHPANIFSAALSKLRKSGLISQRENENGTVIFVLSSSKKKEAIRRSISDSDVYSTLRRVFLTLSTLIEDYNESGEWTYLPYDFGIYLYDLAKQLFQMRMYRYSARLFYGVSLFSFHKRCDSVKALSYIERAIRCLETVESDDDVQEEMGTYLSHCAEVLREREEFDEALRIRRRELYARESFHGVEDSAYADVLLHMCEDARENGDIEKAMEFGEKALKIFEENVGKDHCRYAEVLVAMAAAQVEGEEAGERERRQAKEWCENAERVAEKVLRLQRERERDSEIPHNDSQTEKGRNGPTKLIASIEKLRAKMAFKEGNLNTAIEHMQTARRKLEAVLQGMREEERERLRAKAEERKKGKRRVTFIGDKEPDLNIGGLRRRELRTLALDAAMCDYRCAVYVRQYDGRERERVVEEEKDAGSNAERVLEGVDYAQRAWSAIQKVLHIEMNNIFSASQAQPSGRKSSKSKKPARLSTQDSEQFSEESSILQCGESGEPVLCMELGKCLALFGLCQIESGEMQKGVSHMREAIRVEIHMMGASHFRVEDMRAMLDEALERWD